ncbi:MAG: MFS transporter [Acidiferrobacteraceae bacterium]
MPESHTPLRLALLHRAWRMPKRYIAPWYIAYLLLGAATAGIFSLLVPLMIVAVSHRPSLIAYVFGAYNLGLLTSPIWGKLTERRRDYRFVFLGGFFVAACSIVVLPMASGISVWCLLAFLTGLGTAAASTVASLFIFDFAPREEWEPRIGWLQSFNGFGLVVGLLIAGALTGALTMGLWVAGGLMFAALFVGGIGLPVKRTTHPFHLRETLQDLDFRSLAAFGYTEFLGRGFLHHSHHLNLAGLRQLPRLLPTAFGRFLVSWFSLSFGVAAFFAYFPILLQQSYGLPASLTALTYAIAAGVGIVLYVQASRWCSRWGSDRVYRWSLVLRWAGFVTLFVLYFLPLPGKTAIALFGFACIVLAWPALSVSGTALAGRLSPLSEGEAIGLFNASTAIATISGTLAGGPLAATLGYAAVLGLGVIGIGLAWLPALTRHSIHPEPVGSSPRAKLPRPRNPT